jgi:lysophospholipase L1-like esterase
VRSRLLLVVLSVIVALMGAEVALRVGRVRLTGSTFRPDSVLGWSLRPGAVAWEADEGVALSVINSHGFRDVPRSVVKPHGMFRIAVLGDSYTEARQVDVSETYVALTETLLAERGCTGKSVEVLNFGIGGFGTAQELLLLRQRVWQFEPDVVVLQFYAGNDLFNNSRALNVSSPERTPYFVLEEDRLVLDDSFRHAGTYDPRYIRLKGIAADALNSSRLLLLLYKVRLALAQRQQAAPLDGAAHGSPPVEYQKYLMYVPPVEEPMRSAWKVTEALLLEAARDVSARGARFLLLLLPTLPQINPDSASREDYRTRYGIRDLEYADARLQAFAEQHDLAVVRAGPVLRERAEKTGAFMAGFPNTGPNDGHLNQEGHRVVAEELARAICRMTSGPASSGAP